MRGLNMIDLDVMSSIVNTAAVVIQLLKTIVERVESWRIEKQCWWSFIKTKLNLLLKAF